MRRALFANYGPVSSEIDKSYVDFAICLMEAFFHKQKAAIDKVSDQVNNALIKAARCTFQKLGC
jgi:hypothetical protein